MRCWAKGLRGRVGAESRWHHGGFKNETGTSPLKTNIFENLWVYQDYQDGLMASYVLSIEIQGF